MFAHTKKYSCVIMTAIRVPLSTLEEGKKRSVCLCKPQGWHFVVLL